MRSFKGIKKHIKRRRFGKAISVNLRWGLRRVRQFFRRDGFTRSIRGSYAKRLYVMIGLLAAVCGLAYGSSLMSNAYLTDEAVLVRRLSDPDFDRKQPVLAALHCFGSTNRIQVTLKTAERDNLNPQKVDLDRGNLNLVMTLSDGRKMEYTLQNRNIDNFESGNTDQFTLILPSEISVFDITDYQLVLLPDAKGEYGEWHCQWAEISFLLGGKRTTVAADEWRSTFVFSQNAPTAPLVQVGQNNAYYQQIESLYPYALAVCKKGKETVHDKLIKSTALNALGLSDGKTLYLEVETVGLENQTSVLQNQLGTVTLSEFDQLDYDGTMALRVEFYSDAAGSYVVDYPLDTPGKDDFELGTLSTFQAEMPEGLSVFDIRSMELMVLDPNDAWAPRMLRAYLRTDYGVNLELARITDTTLTAGRGTCVFYKDLINTRVSPLAFDLTATYQLPKNLAKQIEETYGTAVTGVAYSMYFNEFDFYGRQKLFYSQVKALYGGEENA